MTTRGSSAPGPGTFIRSVTGDIPPAELGSTSYHEHLLMRSPLLPGDELDDAGRSSEEAAALKAAGIDALVELTPIGCGRDPRGLLTIAGQSGVTVVAATGIHREAHYPPQHWAHQANEETLYELFVRDLMTGCDGSDHQGTTKDPTDIRAGVIKVGAGYWSISSFERRVLEAAGEAHLQTGAPLACHLERGSAAWEVGSMLADAGVPADRVALAHVDRNPDPGLHIELAAAGYYLGYDGVGRAKDWPDSVLLDCLVTVAEGGGADRLLLGGDVSRRSSFRAYGGLPGMTYLPERFVPRLRALGGDELVDTILVYNPRRWLAFTDSQV